ncbi:pyrimidine-nucleoside phosphorylase [Clostridium sp.]|uniref:pyrimidine-nucleoside phosphorylase n=1 Tax=Clostridium sp. TaxID=1506 RepID=UPI0026259126|nr:pyrimidine-nucleoside phosphorylase [Clostridium sp.]
MRMYDLIMKKKSGQILTKEEISYMVKDYVLGEIPDYQMSAMLMAICFQGMNEKEITEFTMEIASSGDMVDLSEIEGIKVDKHSTGGVGDKTTLVIGPIVAACGVKVAKMSGRGLGHTGGTIDKLEAIPGMKVDLNQEKFFSVVNEVGVSVVGQSGNLAPADKKLYALRDVTGTVDSIPLIAASIMSKKLASGSNCILLDVKTGSGAFMKTIDGSIELAKCMVSIGEHAGRKTMAVITDMDIPLGKAIGNSLEVIEAIETLKGKGPEDLTEVCLSLASNMLYLAGKGEIEECRNLAKEAISSGAALQKLVEMVDAQEGDSSVILDTEKFTKASYSYELKSSEAGYITHMDTEGCGIASVVLGAGRETKDSEIDYSAGIVLNKKTGDYVNEGDTLAILYASSKDLFSKAESILKGVYTLSKEKIKEEPLIFAKVSIDSVERY